MGIENLQEAAQQIGRFLQTFTVSGGLKLRFRVKIVNSPSGQDPTPDPNPELSPVAPDAERTLYVEFAGPDTPLLTARNGEVLHALEHLAVKMLRLEPDQQQRVSFDADHFKANHDRQMRESAVAAIDHVRATGRPHPFPAMNARDRRTLHLILAESGLPTASSGEGPGRFVVLYPEGADTSRPVVSEGHNRADDSGRVRQAFRHR
jgi:spoIIIJ-associated protein